MVLLNDCCSRKQNNEKPDVCRNPKKKYFCYHCNLVSIPGLKISETGMASEMWMEINERNGAHFCLRQNDLGSILVFKSSFRPLGTIKSKNKPLQNHNRCSGAILIRPLIEVPDFGSHPSEKSSRVIYSTLKFKFSYWLKKSRDHFKPIKMLKFFTVGLDLGSHQSVT